MAISTLRARATRGTHAQRIRRILLFLATVLLLVAAVGSFAVVHHDAHVAALRSAAGRVAVLATVVTAPALGDAQSGPCATVQFCTPDGRQHEATVTIGPTLEAGQKVPLWVTPAGALTSAPSVTSPLRDSVPGWVAVSALSALLLLGVAMASAWWARRHDEREFAWIVEPLRGEEQSWDNSLR